MEAVASNNVLFQQGSVSIEKSQFPTDAIVEFLAETVWGTPGGTRFRHLDTRELIHDLLNPYFVSCYRRDALIALVSFYKRLTARETAFYIHHLAFQQGFRVKKKSKEAASANPLLISPKSWIKQLMVRIFDDPQLLDESLCRDDRSVYYAFIEAENTRSLEMASSFGFQKFRSFGTIPFSRLNPKKHPDFAQLMPKEQPGMRVKLEEQYKDYSLFFTDHIFLNDNYYVLRKDGEIIAGVQAQPVKWAIEELPGFSGTLTMKLVPSIPLLSRLFNPKNFNPVIFEAIYCKPGHEGDLSTLFESVLAEMQVNSGLIWLDNQSDLFNSIRRAGNLGLLDKLQQAAPADVIARFVNYSDEEIAAFHERPVYISAFDLT